MRILAFAALACLATAASAQPSAPAAPVPTPRRASVARAFRRTHKCPYRVCVTDHNVSLVCGGLDGPPRDTIIGNRRYPAWSNLQYQTPTAAALKDKTEQDCAHYKGRVARRGTAKAVAP